MKSKFKINRKNIIIIFIIAIIVMLLFGINYCLFSPSSINKYIASNIYKTPANSAFKDDNFYTCVVDTYNRENRTSIAYTTSLSDEELQKITSLSCYNKDIKDASGLEKMTALTFLNVYNNQLTSLDVSKNTSLTTLWAINKFRCKYKHCLNRIENI